MAHSSISEFYNNKNIFITGGSGFIGKVLVEKLLRSCPNLQTIYLLMRPKKEKSPEERIKTITDLPLFDVLRAQNPDAFQKIKLINGDVKELELGLSPDDRKLLIEEVNIVFHSAASIRFDDTLKYAVLVNTRGTREVARIALEMKHLDVFVHVSTTYCNTDNLVVEEKLYPPHADWQDSIKIVENMDEHTLNVLTEKYLDRLPNTYTLSKSLAEHAVSDVLKGKVPTVIVRPSIVISTHSDPFPGWVDNINGPVGLLIACASGLLKSNHANPDVAWDVVAVDMVVKCLLTVARKQVAEEDPEEKFKVAVYNCSNNNICNLTSGALIETGTKMCWDVPMNYVVWFPGGSITRCFYYHWFRLIFYQLIPALLLDGVLKLAGYKPMLMRAQRRIYMANDIFRYYCTNQWVFVNDKTMDLRNGLHPDDIDNFWLNIYNIDIDLYLKNATIGARRYILKYTDDTLETAKKNIRKMWVLQQVNHVIWCLILFWILFVKIDIVSFTTNKLENIYCYFEAD